jgi:hypothetical protein
MVSLATDMRPRISIAALLAGMVPIAVGLAALANPTALWEGVVFALTLLTLFTAIVGVLYRRGAGRAFWVGFALFGWGFFVLASDISIEIGSSASIQNGRFWSSETEREQPVSALVRNLVDFVQLNRTSFPRSTGDKVQVLWGNPGTYFPCTVLQINGNQFRIRYDSDPQGTWDEWVGTPRIKSANADRCYRIAELLFALLFGLAGAMIALWFFATSKADQSGTNSDQAAGAQTS